MSTSSSFNNFNRGFDNWGAHSNDIRAAHNNDNREAYNIRGAYNNIGGAYKSGNQGAHNNDTRVAYKNNFWGVYNNGRYIRFLWPLSSYNVLCVLMLLKIISLHSSWDLVMTVWQLNLNSLLVICFLFCNDKQKLWQHTCKNKSCSPHKVFLSTNGIERAFIPV